MQCLVGNRFLIFFWTTFILALHLLFVLLTRLQAHTPAQNTSSSGSFAQRVCQSATGSVSVSLSCVWHKRCALHVDRAVEGVDLLRSSTVAYCWRSRLAHQRPQTRAAYAGEDVDGSRVCWLARLDGGAMPRERPGLQVPDSLGAVAKKMPRPGGAVCSARRRCHQRAIFRETTRSAGATVSLGCRLGLPKRRLGRCFSSCTVRERDGAQRGADPVRAGRVDDAGRVEWSPGSCCPCAAHDIISLQL